MRDATAWNSRSARRRRRPSSAGWRNSKKLNRLPRRGARPPRSALKVRARRVPPCLRRRPPQAALPEQNSPPTKLPYPLSAVLCACFRSGWVSDRWASHQHLDWFRFSASGGSALWKSGAPALRSKNDRFNSAHRDPKPQRPSVGRPQCSQEQSRGRGSDCATPPLSRASHVLPNRDFWEAATGESRTKCLILLVGVQGFEPWTR